MTCATHNSFPGCRANTAKQLSAKPRAGELPHLSPIRSGFYRLNNPESPDNQWICAISVAETPLVHGSVEGFATGDLVPTSPGKIKSNGETERDAAMPPQPLINDNTAKQPATIATFRFTVKGAWHN